MRKNSGKAVGATSRKVQTNFDHHQEINIGGGLTKLCLLDGSLFH